MKNASTVVSKMFLVCALLAVIGLPLAATAADTETTLYTFTGGSDGYFPLGHLVADKSGNLYGTTLHGGSAFGFSGMGTVFELSPDGQGGWTFNVLHQFDGTDGQDPYGLSIDSFGNLYGTCFIGGAVGGGTVFELSPSNDSWVFNTLYNFTGKQDGYNPAGDPVVDSAGNVYGMTVGDGSYTNGTVYELSPSNNGWTFQVLHTFTGGPDGGSPEGGLTMHNGDLWGATSQGGQQFGVIFQLHKTGNSWVEKVLYTFLDQMHQNDVKPIGALTFDTAGRIYGTTAGGIRGHGGVFRLIPSPTAANSAQWQITWLYQFTGGSDGGAPWSGVVFDNAGNIYGTTSAGGSNGNGVVYELAAGSWIENVLWTFTGGSDGCAPFNQSIGVLRDANGNIYATAERCGGSGAAGTIFELTPQ